MGVLRPCGTELTEYALKLINAKPGQRLLDVGCGDGSASEIAQKLYGQKVVAIDIDKEAVEKAKEKGLDARVMDSSMLDFDVKEFDTVLMECSFSVLERQEESFHEAYCVLKDGGNLIISDVYCRNPDLERWEKEYWEAMVEWRKPRLHENCGKEEHKPSPYTQDGMLVLKGIYDLAEELEMEVAFFEDRTKELQTFAAQAVMDYGSIENWLKAEGTWKPCCGYDKRAGYFLMIIHKKNKEA